MPKKRKIFDIENLCALAIAKHHAQTIAEISARSCGDYFYPGMGELRDETEALLGELSHSGYDELHQIMKRFVKRNWPLFFAFEDVRDPEEADELWEEIRTEIQQDSRLRQFLK